MGIDVKKIFQELVVPELQEIKSEIKVLSVEIRRLDEKIDTGLARLDEKIEGVKEDIKNLRGEFNRRYEDLKEDLKNLRGEFHLAIDIHERIASLEAAVAASRR